MVDTARSLQLAEQYLQIGRPADAITALTDVVLASPDDPVVLTTLSAAQHALGQNRAAADTAARALAATPFLERAWRVRALSLAELGRAQEAAESAAEAVRVAPEFWPTHLTVATVALRTRKVTKTTLVSAEKAVQLHPEGVDAHVTRAQVLLALRRWDDARTGFQHALQLDPQSGDARLGLSTVELQQDSTAAPSRLAADYLRDDPQSMSARFTLCVPFMNLLALITVFVVLLGILIPVVVIVGPSPGIFVGLISGFGVTIFAAARQAREARTHAIGFGGFLTVLAPWPRRGVILCIIGLVGVPATLVLAGALQLTGTALLLVALVPVIVAVGGAVLMYAGWMRRA